MGSSKSIQKVREEVEAVGRVPWPIRIEGPTGVGKGLVARLIHEASARKGAFIMAPVTMVAAGLEVGSLTDHVKGAFTGASQDQAGPFEAAHRGTLFLDEIGSVTPAVQAALLHLPGRR